jgi:uncharacterized phiE125 gp8 family phage protein
MGKLILTVEPTVEPLTLGDAKAHLRVTNTQDDNLITALITAARKAAERYTNRAFITQTWQVWFDRFFILPKRDTQWWDGQRDGYIADLFYDNAFVDLGMAGVQSISSLNYFDLSNNPFVYDAANYFLDKVTEPARLCLNVGSVLPTGVRSRNAFYIEFIAGYGVVRWDSPTSTTPGSVPNDIVQGIRMILSHLYENRGDQIEEIVIPKTAQFLLQPYRPERLFP